MIIKCIHCNNPITEARIVFFLELRGEYPNTCTNCSSEKKNVVFMDYAHKTAGEIVIVDSSKEENLRRAKRVFKRSR